MRVESLLRYWTLHSPAGHVATCDLVRTEAGLEVRCDWKDAATQPRVTNSAAIQAMAEGLTLADSWRAAHLAKGWMPRAAGDSKAG